LESAISLGGPRARTHSARRLAARLAPFEVRHYGAEQEALARRWLSAEPAAQTSASVSVEEIKA